MLYRYRPVVSAALVLCVVACDRPPTEPPAAGSRPSRAVTTDATTILAQDLGTLPGDERSEATFVTEDGVVYGRSFAPGSDTPRFFSWTQDGGMVEVSAIPQPPVPPLPTLPSAPPPFEKAFPFAANAKGEATGALCVSGCDSPPDPEVRDVQHAFRFSAGAGVQDIDLRFFEPPDGEPVEQSQGWSINKWGHIAGAYWPSSEGDPVVFFWTPADSFRLLAPMTINFGDMQVNDLDQVIGTLGGSVFPPCAFVWRADLGTSVLPAPNGVCGEDETTTTRALAQQNAGPLVVGWTMSGGDSEENPFAVHATLWEVPAADRTDFPQVNARVYTQSSTLHLKGGPGVLYYVTFTATQSLRAGPYLQVVDWGDGTSSRRARSRLGPIYAASHTYTEPGVYWVRVYVKDAEGRWGVDERRVTVTE